MELGRRERADERQAFRKRAAGVEVAGESNRRPGVDQGTRGRHRTVEEERARRKQDAGDVTGCEGCDPVCPGRLEMVDGTRAELNRDRDRARLRELVAVQAE